MHYIWLSHLLENNSPLYGGGNGEIKIKGEKSIKQGGSCNTMHLTFPNHAGTHIDAPKHFFNNGFSVDYYPADFWIFKNVEVVCLEDINPGKAINGKDIDINKIDNNAECLLIKTNFGKFRGDDVYWENSPYFTYELARALKSRDNIRLVGIDFISVSNINNKDEGRLVHKTLLSFNAVRSSILILEDMDLSGISDAVKIKKVWVFPLRVKNADGAPCSVIAEI